jgi:hypothetical protein
MMSDNKDNPFYIDQDAAVAGFAALGDWLDKHGPLAAWENTMSDATHKAIAHRIAETVAKQFVFGTKIIPGYDDMHQIYTFYAKRDGVAIELGSFTVEALETMDEAMIVGVLNNAVASWSTPPTA